MDLSESYLFFIFGIAVTLLCFVLSIYLPRHLPNKTENERKWVNKGLIILGLIVFLAVCYPFLISEETPKKPEIQKPDVSISSFEDWVNIGESYFQNSQYDDAINAYNQALRIDPKNATILYYKKDTLIHLANNYYYRSMDYQNAILNIDQAIAIDNNDSNLWVFKGDTDLKLNKIEDALQAYEKALDLNPQNPTALAGKSKALSEGGDYQNALFISKEALRINPDEPYALAAKGKSLNYYGKYEEAFENINRSLQIDANDATNWETKGDILYNLGDYKGSLEAYYYSLQLNPNNQNIIQKQRLITNKLGSNG